MNLPVQITLPACEGVSGSAFVSCGGNPTETPALLIVETKQNRFNNGISTIFFCTMQTGLNASDAQRECQLKRGTERRCFSSNFLLLITKNVSAGQVKQENVQKSPCLLKVCQKKKKKQYKGLPTSVNVHLGFLKAIWIERVPKSQM